MTNKAVATLLLYILTLTCNNLFAQTVVNTYAEITAISADKRTITYQGTKVGTLGGFAVDMPVLIARMQGSVISSTYTGIATRSQAKEQYEQNGVGEFQEVIIKRITPNSTNPTSGSIEFSSPLTKNFGTGYEGMQIISFPYVSDLSSANYTALAWNGKIGGVLALQSKNTLTLNNTTLNVSGKGFRGGHVSQNYFAARHIDDQLPCYSLAPLTAVYENLDYNQEYYTDIVQGNDYTNLAGFGGKGEGIIRSFYSDASKTTTNSVQYIPFTDAIASRNNSNKNDKSGLATGSTETPIASKYSFGRGRMVNAGGGGIGHNSGGGGGANFTDGGQGGPGYRTSDCAFDANSLLTSGGGYYGISILTATNIVGEECSVPTKFFLGGGGGGGQQNESEGADGASGGGIVVVKALALEVKGSCSIKALGAAITASERDGAGGGGAGGMIYLVHNTVSGSGTLLVDTSGGAGVSSEAAGFRGGGGGGGQGLIYYTVLNARITYKNDPGAGGLNGTNNNASDDEKNASKGESSPCKRVKHDGLPTTLLPLVHIQLRAKESSGRTQLRWDASWERDIISYEVERSEDGVVYSRIGVQPTQGRQQASYLFETEGGMAHYRIKAVAQGGGYVYSQSVQLLADGQQALQVQVSPVPLGDYPLSVQVAGLPVYGQFSLQVFSISGQQQAGYTYRADAAGSWQGSLPESALWSKGVYLLRIQDADGRMKTVKLIR